MSKYKPKAPPIIRKNFNTNLLLTVTIAMTKAIKPPIKGAKKINAIKTV